VVLCRIGAAVFLFLNGMKFPDIWKKASEMAERLLKSPAAISNGLKPDPVG
jgi:hypothetical protein